MEAAIKDFQDWLLTLPPITRPEYYGIFDQSTGKLIEVRPDYLIEPSITNKIKITDDIADSIFSGKTSLSSYVVDFTTASLEIIEIKFLNTIDDVLHRIIDKQWSDYEDPDVLLIYDRKLKSLKIRLSQKYYNGRKVHWDGSTEMSYLITDYNDPNIPYEMFKLTLDDIIDKEFIIENLNLPKNFSIYTRRLFKQYMIEVL